MSFLDHLRVVGGKLGLIQVSAAATPQAEPSKVKSRQVTLAELSTEVHAEQVRALSELPAELGVKFDKVFETAGIKPPSHGWSVERLQELLKTDQFKTMDRASAQKAILGLLSAVKASVEDVVKDAMARDQALDKFEMFVKKKMEDRTLARQVNVTDLEEQIRGLQKQCEGHREETRADEERWREWRRRKVTTEHELAWAIGFLCDHPVITTEPLPPEEGKPL